MEPDQVKRMLWAFMGMNGITDEDMAAVGYVKLPAISALAYELDLEQEWGALLDALDELGDEVADA